MIKKSSFFINILVFSAFQVSAFAQNYTLYFAKGAASLAPEMLLKELKQPITLQEVDLSTHMLTKDGSDYYKINQTGMVPAISLKDGKLLTETAVILQYFGDKDKSHRFLPAVNTEARYFVLEKLNFIATEIHKSIIGILATKDKDFFSNKITKYLGQIDSDLDGKNFIANNKLSIADFYLTSSLFEIKHLLKMDLSGFKNINKYLDNMAKRSSVKEVLESEGLGDWLK
jgi:glutathione S-transferase